MTAETGPSVLAALDDLLERERAALLSGRLDQMSRILTGKTALIDALGAPAAFARPDLEALKAKARRNQTLLDGTLQGLRRATTRIAALRQVRDSFETYDETGRRRRIGADAARQVEKRA